MRVDQPFVFGAKARSGRNSSPASRAPSGRVPVHATLHGTNSWLVSCRMIVTGCPTVNFGLTPTRAPEADTSNVVVARDTVRPPSSTIRMIGDRARVRRERRRSINAALATAACKLSPFREGSDAARSNPKKPMTRPRGNPLNQGPGHRWLRGVVWKPQPFL